MANIKPTPPCVRDLQPYCQQQEAELMTTSLAYLVHPVMSRALIEAEKIAKDGILEPFPKDRNTSLRPEENPNGPLSALNMPSTPRKDNSFPHPTICAPVSPPQVASTSTPVSLTPDAEFRIIEAELATCEMTREALARREAALRERKAEIIRETKMRLDQEVRELAVGDKEEEMNEGLYMRDVQRRLNAKLQIDDKNTNEAVEQRPEQVEEVKEKKKVISISAPERRRLARLALFKDDPRLG